MHIRYYILFYLGLLTNVLLAQTVRFSASASKTQVATGEVFEVTFSINTNAGSFSPPSFDGFEVVSGPNMSSSMTSVNGNSSMSLEYSYGLVPVKTGTFVIRAASIVAGGKKYSSSPLRITVVKGTPVQQRRQTGSGALDAAVADAGTEDIGQSLFIRTIVNKPSVYHGEQLNLTYRLYTRVGLESSQLDKMPDFNGFWNEEIQQGTTARWNREIYKGREYNVADIRQLILFPDHAGDIRIEPMAMTFLAQQRVPARDIMEQFFGDNIRTVRYQAKSNAVTIHVKPLPEAGKPAGFSGAVGRFSARAYLDKNEIKANEPLNFRIRISGAGNIILQDRPNVVFPADFEKYDPKVTDSISKSQGGVSGHRDYNYLLIPRHQGSYTIEPLKFSWFDPQTGRYESLSTQRFTVKVNKGDFENGATTYAGEQQDIRQLGKDIRYIKTGDPGINRRGEGFYGSAAYYLLLLLGPLAFGLAFVYRKKNAEFNSDAVKVKSLKAGKVAARHLADAEKELQAGNSKVFYEAVSRSLYGYLSDKLNIGIAGLNKETIKEGLHKRNIGTPLITELTDTLDLCEMARYAPVSGISEKDVFERTKNIINEIESRL